MAKIWKWIAIVCLVLLVVGAVLIGVAYATGSSAERLIATTDITDMTKFISRDQLETYVRWALGQ